MASIITLTLFLNNCNSEKRFGFREKVRVYHNRNSTKVIQKVAAKPTDVLTTSNEKNIAPKLKVETVVSKKLETKILSEKHLLPIENVTASIYNSKPDVLKILPSVEEENNLGKSNILNKPNVNYPREINGYNLNAVIGFILIFTVVGYFLYGGLIFSIIGWHQINKYGQKGKGFAIVSVFLWPALVVYLVLYFIFTPHGLI
ncbi:MAG: hypothetical protein WCO28_05275 [Bacteroidota bacterium]